MCYGKTMQIGIKQPPIVFCLKGIKGALAALFEKLEQWRITVHLWRVELELRSRDVSHLSIDLQKERVKNIERLQKYRKRGIFPKNLDFHGQQVPYFKDAFTTPCAVAYLMEQSGWQNVVNTVARTDNHVYVNTITGGAVLQWIQQSGLTQAEAARIQPTYSGDMGWGDYGNGRGGYEPDITIYQETGLSLFEGVSIAAMSALSLAALTFILIWLLLRSRKVSINKGKVLTIALVAAVATSIVGTSIHLLAWGEDLAAQEYRYALLTLLMLNNMTIVPLLVIYGISRMFSKLMDIIKKKSTILKHTTKTDALCGSVEIQKSVLPPKSCRGSNPV